MIKVAVRHIPMMKRTSIVLDHQTKHAGLLDCFIRGTAAGCGSDFVVSGFIISPSADGSKLGRADIDVKERLKRTHIGAGT